MRGVNRRPLHESASFAKLSIMSDLRRTCVRPEHPRSEQPAPRRGFGLLWSYGACYLLLVGFLVFAHGCHGDEDNELFALCVAILRYFGIGM